MKSITITGKLKTSINELKNALSNLLNYEPTIVFNGTNDLNFKFYTSIDSRDGYNEIDIIRILVKHCSNFKLEFNENSYIGGLYTSDPYFIIHRYYTWDGKNLKKCIRDYFGPLCEDVNYLLD